jgi:DNA-binding MarR family transcriptional regulator
MLVTDDDGPDDLRRAAITVRRGVVRLSRRMQLERPVRSVSLNQFSLLAHLSRRGPMTVGELAALERAQPQSLTRPLAGLADDGLIVREPDPDDGRRVIIRITQPGIDVLVEDMRQRDSWLALAMTRLSPTERGVLVLAAEVMERISQDADTLALHAAYPVRTPDTGTETGTEVEPVREVS